MTAEALKALLSAPIVLLFVMLAASAGNGLKQIAVVRQTGRSMTFIEYWGHLPETLVTLISNLFAFAILLMSDQLNFASAVSVGYGVNSLADLLPKGRSLALKQSPDDPEKLDK